MEDTPNDGTPFVKKQDYLFGVKHWVQWFPIGRLPMYEVFIYAGTQPSTGLHFFYARRNPKVFIIKGTQQLNRNGFCAFVLDYKRIDEYCQSQGWRSPDAPH